MAGVCISEINQLSTVQLNVVSNNKSENPEPAIQPTKPKQRRRYQCYQYSGEQLQLALQKCREGLSIRECSKRFGVPKSTLWDKLSSRTPPEMTRKGRCVVTRDVENRLVNWILRMNEDGYDVNETQVKEAIKVFLDKTTNMLEKRNNRPGKAWYKNFLVRHPILYHVKNDDVERTKCSDEKLQSWYEESLDTEVPTFVSAPDEISETQVQTQQPTSTKRQMKLTIDYIELTIGQNTTKYYKQCKINNTANDDPMYKAWLTLANHVNDQTLNDTIQPTSHANKRKRKPKHYLSYLSESTVSTENEEPVVKHDNFDTSNDESVELNTVVELQSSTVDPNPLKLLQESEDIVEPPRLHFSENIIPLDPHKSLLQKSANLIPPKKCLLQPKI